MVEWNKSRPAPVDISPIIAERKMVAEQTTNVPSATNRNYQQIDEALSNDEQSWKTKE